MRKAEVVERSWEKKGWGKILFKAAVVPSTIVLGAGTVWGTGLSLKRILQPSPKVHLL